MKIQGKLEPKYNGIFEVVGKTRLGNYILKNEVGEELKNHYVLSRLKKVSNELEAENIYDYLEVDEILFHIN